MVGGPPPERQSPLSRPPGSDPPRAQSGGISHGIPTGPLIALGRSRRSAFRAGGLTLGGARLHLLGDPHSAVSSAQRAARRSRGFRRKAEQCETCFQEEGARVSIASLAKAAGLPSSSLSYSASDHEIVRPCVPD